MKKNKSLLKIIACCIVILAIAVAAIFLIANLQKGNEGDGNTNPITSFRYEYGSYFGGYYDYQIENDDGKNILTASGANGVKLDIQTELSKKELQELSRIINENNIQEWNNFDGKNNDIMDGYSFHLKVSYKDGTTINADGYESYPNNYKAGHKALETFLSSIGQK